MSPSPTTRLRAAVDACHPGATATVTLVVSVVAAAAGRGPLGIALTGLAVLTGQLSVGWSNDARDAGRDARAGRREKPTVRGDLTARALWQMAFAALALTIPLSFAAAGPVGGGAHVVAVASAWSYNLWLKASVWSAVPFAVSFGLIPAFVTYGLTPPTAPAAWVVATCALMGVGAHLANAIPDVEGDLSVSAGGLVASIGVRAATWAAMLVLVLAVALLLANLGLPGWVALVAVVTIALGGGVVARVGRGQALFRFVLGLALVAVALLVAAAGSITA